MERNSPDKHKSVPLTGKTQPKSENNYMTLPDQTQQKYDNPPPPAKAKTCEGEGRMTARKMYTTFIHKLYDYSLITPFNYGYNI